MSSKTASGAGRGRDRGRGGGAKKDAYSAYNTQNHQAPNLMKNDQLCPVGGRLGSFAHLWPLATSYQFVLQTVTKGYRIWAILQEQRRPGALRSLKTRQDARTSNEASSQCWKNERSGKSPSQRTFPGSIPRSSGWPRSRAVGARSST